MKSPFYGILDLDYPTLSDDDHRQIQLGEKTDLPDGSTVLEYVEQIEIQKEENLAAEARAREAALLSLAGTPEPEQPTKKGRNKEKEAPEDDLSNFESQDEGIPESVPEDPAFDVEIPAV